MINSLKNIIFLWGIGVSTISGTLFYLNQYSNFLLSHPLEISMLVLLLATWAAVATQFLRVESKIDKGLESIEITMLKSDIDRFYKDHKNDNSLTQDEAQYLYMLRDKLHYYEINSFNERKMEYLLKKDIK